MPNQRVESTPAGSIAAHATPHRPHGPQTPHSAEPSRSHHQQAGSSLWKAALPRAGRGTGASKSRASSSRAASESSTKGHSIFMRADPPCLGMSMAARWPTTLARSYASAGLSPASGPRCTGQTTLSSPHSIARWQAESRSAFCWEPGCPIAGTTGTLVNSCCSVRAAWRETAPAATLGMPGAAQMEGLGEGRPAMTAARSSRIRREGPPLTRPTPPLSWLKRTASRHTATREGSPPSEITKASPLLIDMARRSTFRPAGLQSPLSEAAGLL